MFIKIYLSSAPEIPEEHKSATSRSGNLRYKKLIDAVANRIFQGKLFSDELSKDTVFTEETFIEMKRVGKRRVLVARALS